MATVVYNTTAFVSNPAATTYQHVVADLHTDDSANSYHYLYEVTCNLNAVLRDFQYSRNTATNQHTVAGEADSWFDLHKLLQSGVTTQAAPVTGETFLTTMNDGDTDTRDDWDLFWAGMISECIDPQDKDGLSVQIPVMKARTDYATNFGSYPDVATALAAGFENDITNKINDALGATTTDSGPWTTVTSAPFGTQTISVPPTAAQNFLAAVALFLYHLKGSADGTEGALSGDPSDSAVGFAFDENGGIGIRISCSINNSKDGLIRIIQSNTGANTLGGGL